jgi:ubiquinone/menaquinone biosynthesis C-methylase UbiE
MKNAISGSSAFYDNISGFYDEMISFDNSLLYRSGLMKNFIHSGMKTAADLGCGTGLDSVSLALAGLDVTAFDISQGMIEEAKKNSSGRGLNINFINSGIDKIPKEFYDKFDLAVSLGNTLANLNPKTLKKALVKTRKILLKNGMLVIHLLNYEMIKKTNKRIVKISNGNDNTIIRFYDIFKNKFNFNILKFRNSNSSEYEFNSSAIYPYNKKSINEILKQAGFRNIKFYGSLKLDKFEKDSSGDLVITAFKI